MVCAEYNEHSRMAYLNENEVYMDISCSLSFFAQILRMFKERYGDYELTELGEHGVFASFGKG